MLEVRSKVGVAVGLAVLAWFAPHSAWGQTPDAGPDAATLAPPPSATTAPAVPAAQPAPAAAPATPPAAAGTAPAPAKPPHAEHADKPGTPQAPPPTYDVKLLDTLVFSLSRPQGAQTADARGRAARTALEQALRDDRVAVKAVTQGRARVLYAGDAPIIELYPEDAQAAGDETLDVYAARVAARASEVLRTEQKRGDVAEVVLSISILVLFGLMALFLLRWIGETVDRARAWAIAHPDKIPAIRVKTFEVLGSGPISSVLLAALIVGRWLLQISVVYVWLVFAFSRFAVTRPYTERLTSFVITPLSDLAGRLVSALPIGLLALVTAALVYVVVRFVELFFGSVARGETRLAWLPIDLVLPTSLLVRVAVVLLVLVFAGPVVTGDPEGSLARAGSIIMLALALGTTPLLAGVATGIVQVFARRVRVGQHVGIGELRGRVLSVGLLDVRLQDELGREVRVPHLLALVKPVSLHAANASAVLEISVAPQVSATAARDLLAQQMRAHDESAKVELSDADALGMHFRISFTARPEHAPAELRLQLVEALRTAGFGLGQARERRS
jgi:small-conductance mechanosensitive channel